MRPVAAILFAATLVHGSVALSWEHQQIDTWPSAKESIWRDLLASNLYGRVEIKLPSGRADVVTSNEVYELDRPTKWKEGMGQVLAYAQDLQLKPVLAIMSYSRGPEGLINRSRKMFDLAESYCKSNVESAVFTPATAARENRRLHNLI